MSQEEKILTLFRIFTQQKTVAEFQELFEDLCTRKEVERMAERLYAAKQLMEGKTYAQVIQETELSSATLSRISRCVQYGKGYTRVLEGELDD